MAQLSRIARIVQLKTLTTLGVGGPAELWQVEGVSDLREATSAPYRVLGGGSNLLVADDGVPERVVKLGPAYNSLAEFSAQEDPWVGAATPLQGIVKRAAAAGLSGLEGLLGVPGVIGGAVAMNAGTRYGELADTLEEVEVFLDGRLERLPADALGLGYRRSELPDGAIVTRVRLKLTRADPARIAALMAKVDAARAGQPRVRSAGCAFKNPAGDSAGRIIDLSGLKGLTLGRAMVSLEHGNFIVNLGGATARDVLGLIELIRERVPVPLEIEWRLWGCEGRE